MQAPVEIDFQGTPAHEQAKSAVLDHVTRLEQRFGRVTACRVSVKAPGGHHRTGGAYEIHIRLALPNGHEVNVDHIPTADERQSDFDFALNDAFKRARRQLQDHVRKMQGQVKAHEEPSIGNVTRIDEAGGFGFIETNDGRELYFHQNSVLNRGFAKLAVGTRVAFAEEMGEKGPQASTVKPLGKHRMK